jgi:hypothetical protein
LVGRSIQNFLVSKPLFTNFFALREGPESLWRRFLSSEAFSGLELGFIA